MSDYLNVQMTINFKVHSYGFMNDKIGIFLNATDNEICEYIRDNFTYYVKTVDGDGIEANLIVPQPTRGGKDGE